MRAKSVYAKIISVVAALTLWQIAAMAVSHFLLPSPLSVGGEILSLLGESDTYRRLGYTFSSLAGGFLLGLAAGVLPAVLASRIPAVEAALWPFMLTARSVPVVSFIILAYLYMSASDIPLLIAFLIVVPVVYNNVLTGIKGEDRRLREMADVFRLSPARRLLYITLPSLKPHIISASKTGIGLAFKSGVAAEVITIAVGSIGERLYESKLFLETETLFAWTLLLVIVCYGFEWLFLRALRGVFKRLEKL